MATGLNTHHTPSSAPSDADPLLWLRLIRSRRVGAVTFHRLVADHGGVEAALAALPGIARAAGVEEYSLCPLEVVRAEMTQARLARARLLLWGQDGYPQSLMDLADAPPVLWAQGDVGLLARPMVALVGARNASSLGLRMTRRLVEGLAQAGQVVVSGLARGIDAEAHQAALETGTVAVQAGGVDVIYPVENTELAVAIAARGCRISEQPMGLVPQARHFPQRNRIVSGLARAVVVVEAAARSGSLITAKNALDQGREVLAVPGHPFDARAAGCNMLLRDGAVLVRSAQDVLEAIGVQGHFVALAPLPVEAVAVPDPLPGPVPQRRPLADIAAVHSQILARLGPSPLAEDQLIRDLALPPGMLSPALISLELEGRILRQSGGLLSRVD
ncbi:MAG: DNA-processing protein DprA [Erythrobacter sp.]|nr:DNA-processing protein DprA [Erythrobacter sp.]